MTKRKRILGIVFSAILLTCVIFITGASSIVAYAAEIEGNPDDNYEHNNNLYDSCNIYFTSDVFPITVHCVSFQWDEGSHSLTPSENIIVSEYDVVINSTEDYLKVSTYEPSAAYFCGTVITSIKCQGFNPSTCSVDLSETFYSWEENRLSVNKFDSATPYFNGYAVEDTSSKTIELTYLGGYDNGYEDGYDKGVQDGYDTGYDYGYRLGQANSNTQEDTSDTTDSTDSQTDTEEWKTMLGIGAVLILLAIIVLGISKATKQIK